MPILDLDSGSVTALAPGASSPLARANADGSTRSAADDDDSNRTISHKSQSDSGCMACEKGPGNHRHKHTCGKRKAFSRGVTFERSSRARRSVDSAPAASLPNSAGTRVRSARDSTSSKDGADTPVSRPTAAPASAISTTGSSARTTPSSHATESEPGGGTANTPMPDAAELPRAHLAGTAPSAPHTV